MRLCPESRALPGWRADEIHTALNEAELSAQTVAALERVGATLGAREGTGPNDDLQMREHLRQALEKGEAKGRAEGQAQGRSEGLAKVVRQILTTRSIEFSKEFPANVPAFAKASEEAAVNAALACNSEADFGLRLTLLE